MIQIFVPLGLFSSPPASCSESWAVDLYGLHQWIPQCPGPQLGWPVWCTSKRGEGGRRGKSFLSLPVPMDWLPPAYSSLPLQAPVTTISCPFTLVVTLAPCCHSPRGTGGSPVGFPKCFPQLHSHFIKFLSTYTVCSCPLFPMAPWMMHTLLARRRLPLLCFSLVPPSLLFCFAQSTTQMFICMLGASSLIVQNMIVPHAFTGSVFLLMLHHRQSL